MSESIGDLQTRDDGSYGGGEPCPQCGDPMRRDPNCGHWFCFECDGLDCLECALQPDETKG